MLKALGAFVFGLAAVLGVGYLVISKQDDKTLRNQVDCWFFNLGSSLKNWAFTAKGFWQSATTKEPISVTENVA